MKWLLHLKDWIRQKGVHLKKSGHRPPVKKGRPSKKNNKEEDVSYLSILRQMGEKFWLRIKTLFVKLRSFLPEREDLKKRLNGYLKSALFNQAKDHHKTMADRLHKYFSQQAKDPAYLMLKIIGSLVVVFFIWAGFFHIDESVKGTGQIIPSKRLQVINNLEGGIVEAIYVQEGQVVKQGEALIQLDKTPNIARLQEIDKDFYRYQLTIDRLKAQIKREKFEPSEKIAKVLPDFTKQEKELYISSEEKYHKEEAIAQQELEAKKHEYEQAETKLKYSKEKLPVLEEQYTITMQLFEKGLYSKLRTLESKRLVLEAKSDISTLTAQLPALQADIKQAEAKLLKVKSEYDTQNQKELKESELKLADASSNKSIYEDRLKRQTIISPIDGIVKELHAKTIGGVIKPADDIVTIVPLNDELLIEAKIAPDDIGFIHQGLSATIKVTTFDFTIYGRLNGTVQTISADALQDKQEKNYFKVTIQSSQNFLEKYGNKLYLTPGMQVEVDVHTGKRTVLSFLLKPLLKGLNQSFTER